MILALFAHYKSCVYNKERSTGLRLMAKNIFKFNLVVRSRILELCYKGYTLGQIADFLGIHRNTISKWKHTQVGLSEAMTKAFNDGMRDLAYRGHIALAQGVKTTETIREYIEEDASGRMIKVKDKEINHAPSQSALKILAKNYAPELDTINNESTINVLSVDSMSYKELIEYNAKHNPLDSIDATYSEVESGEILSGKLSGKLSGTPLQEKEEE